MEQQEVFKTHKRKEIWGELTKNQLNISNVQPSWASMTFQVQKN